MGGIGKLKYIAERQKLAGYLNKKNVQRIKNFDKLMAGIKELNKVSSFSRALVLSIH
jgi:hypothetical protein